MYLALINGHDDLATKLLERGADPNLANEDGVSRHGADPHIPTMTDLRRRAP